VGRWSQKKSGQKQSQQPVGREWNGKKSGDWSHEFSRLLCSGLKTKAVLLPVYFALK
jgi:hypothetical protein